jgi:hypothetical protein
MFVALGLKNAWRNRGKTALGIVSMAVAAVIFMSSSTLSKGYPARAYWEARQLIGAEILMLPEKIALSTDTLSTGGYTWEFLKRSYDRPNPVMGFDPTPYRYGAMRGVAPDGGDKHLLSMIDRVVKELGQDPNVSRVTVRESLPFLVLLQLKSDEPAFYGYGFIEPRDITADLEQYGLGDTVRGRYLAEGDLLKGVVCSGWPFLQLTGRVSLEFPRMSESGYDYENALTEQIEIVGEMSFRTSNPALPAYSNPVVFVTPQTLEKIKEATGIPTRKLSGGSESQSRTWLSWRAMLLS